MGDEAGHSQCVPFSTAERYAQMPRFAWSAKSFSKNVLKVMSLCLSANKHVFASLLNDRAFPIVCIKGTIIKARCSAGIPNQW